MSKKLIRPTEKSQALLVTNESYLPVLMKLLESAQEKIDIVAFSFAIGSSTGKKSPNSATVQIAEKLIELKKARGLEIRLYIEGFRETADRNRVTGEYLKKFGIKIKYGSTHAKGFCIDDKYVVFGSTNLTNQSIVKNNEANLLLDDPATARGFEKYFSHLWKGGKHGEIKLPPPMIADAGFKDAIVEMINSAESSLEFSIYFFHITEIEKAFIKAHKRGVKVTGFFHQHNSFGLSYVRRTTGTAERMRKAGIENIYYGPGHLFTHSKFLIRDREEVALGTGNWLHEDVKIHPQLYIRLMDAKLALDLALYLEEAIEKQAAPLLYA